jgi:two-component system, NtrC family, sensor kinase
MKESSLLSPKTSTSVPLKPQDSRERRLLVVDDEQVICHIVQGFLENEGWKVDSACCIDDAHALLQRHAYPVILCDVHLPGDSAEFLKFARSEDQARQVIMFTGDPTVSTVREALQHGAYDYLPKPCKPDELKRIVNRAYDKFALLREQERLQAENESYRHQLEEMVEKRTGQLRETELRYRAIFNRAVDAIFLVDALSGQIMDANVAATRLVGVGSAELNRLHIQKFLSSQLDDVLREATQNGHHEWRFPRVSFTLANGDTRFAQMSVGKIELDGKVCLQIVARDITDHLELQEHTELIEQELINEQRLAVIGLMASGIAHNINTPLMGIYGAAQLMKMKNPQLEDVDGIIAQVERINGIIRNLMWKSRQEQDSRFQEINLNQLLHEELKFMEADLDYKHTVTKHISFCDELPTIMGRYSDFSQSIMNVVRNALDAMYPNEEKELTIATQCCNGNICITIKDNGCGIPPENQERIFTPFFSTKPLAGHALEDEPTGTGLGLTTVQRLLSSYGVEFKIESAVGEGTCFTMILPVAQNQTQPDAAEIPCTE